MICSLEFWYLMIVIVIAGHLDNPVIAVDALSIWYIVSFISFRFVSFFPFSLIDKENKILGFWS